MFVQVEHGDARDSSDSILKGIICGFSDEIGIKCGKVKSQDVFKLFDMSHWEKRMPFIEMRVTVLVAW